MGGAVPKVDTIRDVRKRTRFSEEEFEEVRRAALTEGEPESPRWVAQFLRRVALEEARAPRAFLLERIRNLEERLDTQRSDGSFAEADNSSLREQNRRLLKTIEQRDHQIRQLLPGTLWERCKQLTAELKALREGRSDTNNHTTSTDNKEDT